MTGKESPALDRRRFLRGLGLGLAGGTLGGCVPHEAPRDPYRLEKPEVPGSAQLRPNDERHVLTACGQCPAGCGIRVRVVGGHAVSIAGEESNPINQGGIGPRGLAGLQVLYDPDRIAQPMRRRGPRGSDDWELLDWDEAIAHLAERLGGLRESGQAHRVAVVSGLHRGLLLDLFARFSRAYGTPNFFEGLSRKHAAAAQACWLTRGIRDIPTYDWGSTRFVLSLGAGILESSCQAVYFTRLAALLRRGQPGARAKVVQVEASPSKTAQQADQWISIRPGTHAAFALSLSHVLVREDLHDAEFVREHCFGFEPWDDEDGRRHPGLWELLLRDHSPDVAARTCGVEPALIERLAREMARERPAVVAVDERATMAPNGLHVAWAAQTLNALLGSIDRPGGLLTSRPAPTGDWPALEPDEVAQAGLAQPRLDGAGQVRHPLAISSLEELPEALLSGRPYELDSLLLHYSNPVHSGLDPARWKQALAKVPFIASFSPFKDETVSAFADLVLPDHSYLERWEDAAPAPSVGYPVFGLRQPVVSPLHDTRATGDVVLDLARVLGGPVEEALDWKDFRTLLFGAMEELHSTGRGNIVESRYRDFGRRLLSEGHWADPEYEFERWDEVLQTPSGRFEFFSQHLQARLEELAARSSVPLEQLLASWGLPTDPSEAFLPQHVPIAWSGDEESYPLLLEPFTPGTHSEGSGANLPYLQELITERGRRRWSTVADIAPELGERLGLKSGDRAELTSPVGSVELHVHLRPGMRADVVRVPRGGGHEAFGRWAKGWGANVQQLLPAVSEPLGGCPAYLGTRVSLRRIG